MVRSAASLIGKSDAGPDANTGPVIDAGDTTHGDLVIGRESLHVDEILVEGERKSPVAPLPTPEVVFSGS